MAEYMDCAQAANAAKCSVFKIREAIKDGELKAYRPGKGYLIDPADLDEWVRKNAVIVRKRDKKGGVKCALNEN